VQQFSLGGKIFVACATVLIACSAVVLVFTSEDEESGDLARIRKCQEAGDIDGLSTIARAPNPAIARRAVAAMGPLGEKARTTLVRIMQKDARPEVRSKAAITINQVISKGVIEQKDAQHALVTAAESDPSPVVRASAITTLGHSRAYETMDTIIGRLEDNEETVRRASIQSVYKILRVRFFYRPDDPPAKRQEAIKGIQAFWQVPGNRLRVEQYYKGRFKRIYERFAR